jgi:hypothetical protein
MAHVNLLGDARTASGINALVGVWLVLSPWLLGFAADEPRGVFAGVLTGSVVGMSAAARCVWPHDGTSLSWSNLFLGVWTALSPWAFDYAENEVRRWNSVGAGIVLMMCAAWSVSATVFSDRRPYP